MAHDTEHPRTETERGSVQYPSMRRGVDIVIPIYNARSFVQGCTASVLRHATGDYRLVLVDDASTEPGVREDLRLAAAASSRVVLLENAANLGFTATANRGMALHGDRDVLLLNSDTEVFPGFLDRLRDAAYAEEATGIVGPLSNNATHCSIPRWLQDNPIPEGYTAGSLAELISSTARRARPEMVTAVGFCMYVKACVFEDVGYFDEATFGRGYCEEIDFCERAKKWGYRIRIADDVFVWHKGKASFGDEGRERETGNFGVLEAKQPGHIAAYQRFVDANPLAKMQRDIRFHLRRTKLGAPPAVLHLLHACPWDDGADEVSAHVDDLVRRLGCPRALVAFPRGSELVVSEVFDGDVDGRFDYRFPLSSPAMVPCIGHVEIDALLKHWVELFGVTGLHAHEMTAWPIASLPAIAAMGVPLVLAAHDYSWVCLGRHLVDETTATACASGVTECACPIPLSTASESVRIHRQYRGAVLATVERARVIVFPSEASQAVMLTRLGPCGSTIESRVLAPRGRRTGLAQRPPRTNRLRIGVIGDVARARNGRREYEELVEATQKLPVDWHFFGPSSVAAFVAEMASRGLSVQAHVRRGREGASAQLIALGIDVCAILPAWPEPFSHALSEALSGGVPVIANDRGEAGKRVALEGTGLVVRDVADAARAIERLLYDRTELARVTRRANDTPLPEGREIAATYRRLYEELGVTGALAPFIAPRAELLHELADRHDRDRPWPKAAAIPTQTTGAPPVPPAVVPAATLVFFPHAAGSPLHRLWKMRPRSGSPVIASLGAELREDVFQAANGAAREMRGLAKRLLDSRRRKARS